MACKLPLPDWVTAGFALAVFLILWHIKPRWQWPASGALAILIVSVAVSRLYLQVHYQSDVLGSLLAGFIWVFAVNGFLNRRRLGVKSVTGR